jgi:hypothetical protein
LESQKGGWRLGFRARDTAIVLSESQGSMRIGHVVVGIVCHNILNLDTMVGAGGRSDGADGDVMELRHSTVVLHGIRGGVVDQSTGSRWRKSRHIAQRQVRQGSR